MEDQVNAEQEERKRLLLRMMRGCIDILDKSAIEEDDINKIKECLPEEINCDFNEEYISPPDSDEQKDQRKNSEEKNDHKMLSKKKRKEKKTPKFVVAEEMYNDKFYEKKCNQLISQRT